MRKKIIYFGFMDEQQHIVDALHENYGWDPVFFCSPEKMRAWAQAKYPSAVFHDEMALRQGYFDYSKIGKPVPADANILGALSKYEFTSIHEIEDATGWNFSFDERYQHYCDMLKYWNTMILRLKPDVMMHLTWPHSISSYACYVICKHYHNIDVLFMDPMPLLNSNFHAIGGALEDLAMPFRPLYESTQVFKPGADVKEYLARVRSDQWIKGTPAHNFVDIRKWEKLRGFQVKEFAQLLVRMAQGKAFQESSVAFKKNQLPFGSPKSRLNQFDYFWFRDRLRRKDTQLEKIYATFCQPPDFKQKYLYFAASQQPEATTGIGGGVYTNHLLALDILSASIPEDWVIYYKEHPGTFYPMLKGSLRRSRHFYERVKRWKNVRMVSQKTDNFQLIDHAQAVASVCGTSSWEAAVRGKPGLFFGNVWYQACRSLFKIESLQDCRDAIHKIVNGYKPDQKDIERYLSVVEQVATKDLIYLQFSQSIKKCPDPRQEMARTAKAFHEAYEKYYGRQSNG